MNIEYWCPHQHYGLMLILSLAFRYKPCILNIIIALLWLVSILSKYALCQALVTTAAVWAYVNTVFIFQLYTMHIEYYHCSALLGLVCSLIRYDYHWSLWELRNHSSIMDLSLRYKYWKVSLSITAVSDLYIHDTVSGSRTMEYCIFPFCIHSTIT